MSSNGSNRDTRDTQKERFLEHFEEVALVSEAAELAGIGRATVYRWRQEDEDFALKWAAVEARTTERMEEEAYRRAVKGVERPVYQGGKEVGAVREFSDTLLIFMLKARKPETYRERVDLSGTLNLSPERRRSQQRSDDELEKRLAGIE